MSIQVQVDDEAYEAYEVVKKGKKAKFLILKTIDDKICIHPESGDFKETKDASHDDFVKCFESLENEAAYAVYSFSYTTDE